MARLFVLIGAILAGLSVAGGAFGAHALAAQLEEKALVTFETAARYQMYHALALVAVGLLISTAGGNGTLMVAGVAFSIGVVFFCGSLYVLSLFGIKILGAVAPLGGLAFMVGWACLAIASWKLLA